MSSILGTRGMTRRWLVGRTLALAGSAGGASLLAACGAGGQGESSAQKALSGPKVLSYTTFNDVSTPEYKECNQVFSEKFGGVQVEPVVVASGELVAKLTAQLVSGALTDVTQVNIPLFPPLAKAGLFKPIAPFMAKDKTMTAKDFFQGHVQAFTWKGEQLGLTGGLVDENVIFVNKSVFEAGGVKVPTPQESQNWTWTNVVDIARKLTRSDGSQYGLFINRVQVQAFSGGAYWVNDRANATRGTMDDPRWARSMDLWVEWTQRQKVAPLAAQARELGEANMTDAWARGKIAMFHHQSPQIRFALLAEPSLKWDMIWVPKLANDLPRKFISGGAGWGMTPQVRNPDLAWEWIKFIDRKPGSYEINLKHNPAQAIYLSSHIPTTQKELKRLKEMGVANADLLVAGANDLLWPPLHAEWNRIETTIINPELAKMQRGEAAPAAALKDLNERISRELQAAG